MKFVPTKRVSLIDDLMKDSFGGLNYLPAMKTNIIEKDGGYRLEIELPGFTKEEIKVELQQGYLIVKAEKNEEKQQADEQGNVIRRERSSGSCSRRFYISESYSDEDVIAKYENGILELSLRALTLEEKENKKVITIK